MSEPAKLPLNIRKNIRDAEPKRETNLAQINKVTGKTFKVTPNFETNYPLISGWGKETVGDLYYDNILGRLATMLEKNLADSLFKEAFEQTVTKDEIVFKTGPVDRSKTGDQSTYNDVYFEDGCLVYCHTPELCNLDDIQKFNLVHVRGLNQSSKLPLFVRQNLKATENAKNAALDRISKATGNTWTFNEGCMEALWDAYVKNNDSWGRYKQSIGNNFYETGLANLATNIEALCKDDMAQEGFNEAFTAKTIEFKWDPAASAWWVPKNEGGKLVAVFRDLTNFGNLSRDSDFNITGML